MVDGKFSHSFSCTGGADVRTDIEAHFDFHPGTMSTAFSQGYYNNSAYKDCWTSQHWSFSAAFYVGRYMFNKHFMPQHPGSVVRLPFALPAQLAKILT